MLMVIQKCVACDLLMVNCVRVRARLCVRVCVHVRARARVCRYLYTKLYFLVSMTTGSWWLE